MRTRGSQFYATIGRLLEIVSDFKCLLRIFRASWNRRDIGKQISRERLRQGESTILKVENRLASQVSFFLGLHGAWPIPYPQERRGPLQGVDEGHNQR